MTSKNIDYFNSLTCYFFFITILLVVNISKTECVEFKNRPNVIFIVADDQRADTIHALGNDVIKTPYLDGLVKQGMSFTNAYCMGGNSGAVCAPSRNMFMSGQSFFRWGGKRIAPADGPNFPLTMKNAGYETFHTEKSGNVATLIQASFEHINYIKDNVERNSGEHGRKIVDNAIDFLDKRDTKRPFFMYMGLEGPHDPRVAAPHYLNQYQREQIPLPKNFMPFHPFDNGDLVIRDEKLAPWPRTEDDTKKQIHDYYGCITSIDTHLGRFINKLKALNLYENTYIIYTSDHGLAMGSHGLFGKQNIYEDGMRVPFIVIGPDVLKGQQTNAFCYLMDIFPTVCDLTDVKAPSKLDGISFAPVLQGNKTNSRNRIFLSYLNVQKSCREGDYKLIRYPLINKTQLFNLADDPHELKDISNSNPDKCQTLLIALKEQQQVFGDADPLEVANPQSVEVNAEEINRRAKLGLENPLNMKKQ